MMARDACLAWYKRGAQRLSYSAAILALLVHKFHSPIASFHPMSVTIPVTDGPTPKSQAHWATFDVINKTHNKLGIRGAHLETGDFYDGSESGRPPTVSLFALVIGEADRILSIAEDKSKTIDEATLNKAEIEEKNVYLFGACGAVFNGAEGRFDIQDLATKTRLATIYYYSAAEATSYNSLLIEVPDPERASVSQKGANCGKTGPLGDIYLTVVKPDLS